MYLLLLVVVLIVHGCLPWHIDFAHGVTNPFPVLLQAWPDRWDYNAIQDAVLNLVLYLPLGVAAFRVMARKYTVVAATTGALCFGLILSTGIELLQVYVPERNGSICDILFNFIGTIAGIALARCLRLRIETVIAAISRILSPWYSRLGSPPSLLLVCWVFYQLYPIVPHFSPGSMPAETMFLLNPRAFDTNSPYLAEILVTTAEWFAVMLAIQSLFGRMRPYWMFVTICVRFLVRPFLWTRLFALDELLGAALATLLWIALGETIRRRIGLALLAAALVLRQLAPLHFSRLPYSFSPSGDTVRRAFDCGALVWILYSEGISPDWAGVVCAVFLAVLGALHRYLSGSGASIADPVLMSLVALAFWLRKSGWVRSATATGTY